jgi:beta-phosphoglucomutase-like phosphatase (HAD superfamily)
VENAPLGIQSAKAAGMTCVALETTLPPERLAAADLLFSDTLSLRAWLLSQGTALPPL